VWSIAIYRFGRWVRGRSGPACRLLKAIHTIAYSSVRLITGIDLPSGAAIGPGLKIEHFGGVTVHEDAVVGARATLHHGVTVGVARPGGEPPLIGDDVFIGAYAQILGPISVGHRATIGAMAVVVHDVPDDAVVVGNPARVVGTDVRTDGPA